MARGNKKKHKHKANGTDGRPPMPDYGREDVYMEIGDEMAYIEDRLAEMHDMMALRAPSHMITGCYMEITNMLCEAYARYTHARIEDEVEGHMGRFHRYEEPEEFMNEPKSRSGGGIDRELAEHTKRIMKMKEQLANEGKEEHGGIENKPDTEDEKPEGKAGPDVQKEKNTETKEETVPDTADGSEADTQGESEPQPEEPEDTTPAYVVFYSKNHAAYVSIDEKRHACVPVRNMAKAYCVKADVSSIAAGQNELSKYRLDKMKPLEIKFLTQKEYDETIGRAEKMKDILAAIPDKPSVDITANHTVTNFASSSENTGKSHIGENRPSNYGEGWDNANWRNYPARKPCYNDYGYYGDYDYWDDCRYYENERIDRKTGYNRGDKKRAKPSKSEAKKAADSKYINGLKTGTKNPEENPMVLYIRMHKHDGKDIDEICYEKQSSLGYDYETISSTEYIRIANDNDFTILINVINGTIRQIENTKSSWLLNNTVARGFDIEPNFTRSYLMDMDYAKLQKAIDFWNEMNDCAPPIMYVEKFDPTINDIGKNIEMLVKELQKENSLINNDPMETACTIMSMAIYNYVRCIIAYEIYMANRFV